MCLILSAHLTLNSTTVRFSLASIRIISSTFHPTQHYNNAEETETRTLRHILAYNDVEETETRTLRHILACSLMVSCGTLVAPICCVMPPASPSWTFVLRSWNNHTNTYGFVLNAVCVNLTQPVQPDFTIINDHRHYHDDYQSVPIM